MVKPRILVVCTHNSARSQMAEGFLRHFLKEQAEVASAGLQATQVHPLAIQAMQEVGLDISTHTSNTIQEYSHIKWDYVITVCDGAKEKCPYVPARHHVHISFPDPSQVGTLEAFQKVRDQIQSWAQTFARQLLD